jgi:hypothetical protein
VIAAGDIDTYGELPTIDPMTMDETEETGACGLVGLHVLP